MREDWLALVSHELIQPASNIRLLVDALSGDARLASAQDLLDQLRFEAERVTRVASDLLETMTFDPRRVPLRRAPVDLFRIAQDSARGLEQQAEDRPMRVLRRGRPGLAVVDPVRVRQVLDNLISNAVRYGDPGTAIEIVVASEGAEWRVRVTNAGPALAPEALGRLFERFTRGPFERRAGGGIGVGLFLSRALVQAHGGQIRVRCAEGLTTFEVHLPV